MNKTLWEKHVASIPDSLWKQKKKKPAYEQGRRFGDWLERNTLVYDSCKVLDFGCHYGRVAVGLHDKCYEYIGIDVLPDAILACRNAFSGCDNMAFLHVDSANKIYNPNGKTLTRMQAIPVPSGSVSVALAISVMPHQESHEQAEHCFRELARVVGDHGKLIISWNGSPLDDDQWRKKFFQRDFVLYLYRKYHITVDYEVDNFNLETIDEVDLASKSVSTTHAGQTLLIGRKIPYEGHLNGEQGAKYDGY